MIAAPIQEAIGPLLLELENLGLRVVSAQYSPEHFGNFVVGLSSPRGAVRLVRDRLQYFVDGDLEAIKAAGMFRVYDDVEAFSEAAAAYARSIV